MKLRRYDGSPARNLIFIGDSYQVGTDNNNVSFLKYFQKWYGSEFGDIYHAEQGGYGLAKSGQKFITLLTNLGDTISDKESITDIVLTGGYNDYGSVNSIDSAMNEMMNYVHANYPNATVWLAPVGWTRNFNATFRKQILDAVKTWIQLGKKYGAVYIENIACIFRNPLLLGTYFHPNDDGQRDLALALYQGLIKGECNIRQESAVSNFTGASGTVSHELNNIYSYACNGQCTVTHIGMSNITFANPFNIVADGKDNHVIRLGTVPNLKTFGAAWENPTSVMTNGTTVNVIMHLNGTNTFVNCSCFIFVQHGWLCLAPFGVPDGGTSWRNISVKSFYIAPFEFTCDNFLG